MNKDEVAEEGGCGGCCCSFTWQFLRGRWFMIAAGFWVMGGAGCTYLFGVYSKDIKATLGYDQSTLNLLASMKDLGANFGVPAGLIAEVSPTWLVLLIGAVMNFGGYFLIYLAAVEKIQKPAVWQLCVLICLGAHSQNFANTGALVTCVKNFPESRGMMMGLMKGFVALSGALYTQLYYALYGNKSTSMILLIAWLPSATSLLFIFTLRSLKASTHPREVKVLYQYLYVTMALAICLMGLIIGQRQVKFSRGAYIGSAVAIGVLSLLPFVIAAKEERLGLREKKKRSVAPPTDIVIVKESETLPDSSDIETRKEGAKDAVPCYSCTDICNKPSRGEDYTILQALLSTDMIILFITTCLGLGCNLTTMNNLGQIGESLGYNKNTIGTTVSLASIWGFFGRVFTGFVSETLLLKKKVPRSIFMTIFLLLSAMGNLMIAFPFANSVYIASLINGFCHGSQLTLLFTFISELFGLKYYSTLFNCGQLVAPVGSYVLSVMVVGKLYDKEARKLLEKGIVVSRSADKELTCIGTQCYKTSYVVLACSNVFAALVSLVLVFRTRKFYSGDIYKRFREQMEKDGRDKDTRNG